MASVDVCLLTSLPYAHVLAPSQRGRRCDQCFESLTKPLRCSACTFPRYCNSDCQKKAWKFHRVECRCLQRVSPNVPTESVRLLLRLVLRQKWGDDKTAVETCNGRTRCFEDLMSHVEEIKNDAKRKDEFHKLFHTLKIFVEDELDLPEPAQLLTTFGTMLINSFTICDGEMQTIGSGVYIGASIFDHSCTPNAVAVFSGTTLQIRALPGYTSMDTQSLKNVRISYVDQLAPRQERQTQLRDQYYFTCQCPRCGDHLLDQLMLSTRCPSPDCQCPILQNSDQTFQPCSECGISTFSADYGKRKKEAIQFCKDALIKLKEMKNSKEYPRKMAEVCDEALTSHRSILHPCNVYHLQVLDQAFDSCIDGGLWDMALQHGLGTLEPYRKLNPPFNPNIGVQLMKVGKLQLYLQKLPEALQSLQQAVEILNVTHGSKHQLYKDLQLLLDQCGRELSVTQSRGQH